MTNTGGRAVVWVLGADGRGALFGVGEVLRELRWSPGASAAQPRGLPATLDVTSTPAYAIRGHQLGYRQHSNTYDAWDEARYDRYIRDLALFGANSIENIPLQDTRVSPHFPASRDEMNVAISRVCDRYDLDYWIWTPADYDLADAAKRAQTLDTLEAMFAKMPRLDAIFVPGGDPGSNPATLVLPYLEDLATRVQRHHPRAKVWLSLQWFSAGADRLDLRADQHRAPALAGRTRCRDRAAHRSARRARVSTHAIACATTRTSRMSCAPSTSCPTGTLRSTSRSAANRSTRGRSSTRNFMIASHRTPTASSATPMA